MLASVKKLILKILSETIFKELLVFRKPPMTKIVPKIFVI
jgi:hypothetical protein